MANMSLTKNPMPSQDPNVRNKNFDEVALGYTEEQALDEAQRCLNCKNKPCMTGCPVMVHIPEFIAEVAKGNFEEAYQIISNTSALPAVCGRVCPQESQCEKYCVRGKKGDPVGIGRLERFVADWHNAHATAAPEKPASNGHRVAVVGSGPAGLAAAYYLNHRGHTVTVLEQDDAPGGLLTYGIPAMKLDKALVKRRVALLEAEGITFQCGTTVGRDISPKELDQTYDAVLFACGARKPRPVPYEGDAGGGLCYGLDYLIQTQRHLDAGTPSPLSAKDKRVAIIGAGDTASDCVATALRQGCKSLTQLIRKPAAYYPPELDDAHVESQARFGRDIRRFETTLHALACGKDSKFRQAVLNTPQGEKTLPVDLVIVASGFSGCEDASLQVRDAMPRPEKVFSAGDMVLGASLVVLAIASGKQAAAQADTYLMGCTNIL